MKVADLLAKNVLAPLRITAAASAIDAGIQKKIHGSGTILRDKRIINDGGYVVNPDEYANIGTHWIALYVLNNGAIYFYSFGIEDISKEIRHFIGNKKHKNKHIQNTSK